MKRKALTLLDGVVLAVFLGGNYALFGYLGDGASPAAVEIVSVTGTETLPLGPARHVEVEGPLGTTVIGVETDGASVVSSPCPYQLCVRSGKADRAGQVVACLPNRVAIRILGREDGPTRGVDALTR